MMAERSRPTFNKEAFFQDLGYTPHPGQLEIHRDESPRRIVACGVRWGKTWCAAMEALAAAMVPCERSVGWVVAPTYDLADRVFREILYIAVQHLRHRIVSMRESTRQLVLRNMAGGLSEIRGKSADNPVSLLGEGLDFVIIDEASRLKPNIWQSHLSQRLIDRKGWALLISTPKGKGYFFDLFRLGQGKNDGYRSWNYPSWTNPLLDAELIERERGCVPERVFRQEYGAEFIEGSGAGSQVSAFQHRALDAQFGQLVSHRASHDPTADDHHIRCFGHGYPLASFELNGRSLGKAARVSTSQHWQSSTILLDTKGRAHGAMESACASCF